MKQQVQSEPEKMLELLEEFVPEATEAQHEQLTKFYVMLIDRNNVMNLTAITDPEGVASRHFADSLLASHLIPEGAKVIDVGTGAGFPGIPLAIMRPDLDITLLDSLNKRVKFLSEVTAVLGLNCRAVHARAEDGAKMPQLREKFDFVLSRAVAEIPVLSEWTLPFAKVGGSSCMYKGPGAEVELAAAQNALKILHGKAEIRHFGLPWGERNLVLIKKTAATPAKYPRKAGTAEKNPL